MTNAVDTAVTLSGVIEDGSFPDSVDLLTSELTSEAISSLLGTISTNKRDLSEEIRSTSQSDAHNVDEWILQAKRVQSDIARCKDEARKIVEHHERINRLRNTSIDASSKVNLLSSEIAFTETLETGLREVAAATLHLNHVEQLIQSGNLVEAARALNSHREQISRIGGPRARSLLQENSEILRRETLVKLEAVLNEQINVEWDKTSAWILIRKDDGEMFTMAQTLNGLKLVDAFQPVGDKVADKIENFLGRILRQKSHANLKSHSLDSTRFSVTLSDNIPDLETLFSFIKDYVTYLHSTLPPALQKVVAQRLVPNLTSSLISDWLNPAVPSKLSELSLLDDLRSKALEVVSVLKSFSWAGFEDLEEWTEQVPRTWLTKRKASTLDSVRKGFITSHKTMHQVERIERQIIGSAEARDDVVDDWNTDWDDGKKEESRELEGTEDDASGWGFDDDDNITTPTSRAHQNGQKDEPPDVDVGDAWGWGEDNAEENTPKIAEPRLSKQVNGAKSPTATSKEVVLTELYSITDIPDHLVEVIGKDLSDATTIQQGNPSSLSDIPAATGLLALPTLALAMFRATAPTQYTTSGMLGNMNLYNDSLYIIEKLRDLAAPSGMQNLDNDCKAMEKFARSAYAREMETQRTILSDLLDGVQGFSNCNQFPYSQEIESAVSTTVDRVRQVHQEWKPILSVSALLQSVGSLVSMVISKVIVDIEELEDISEVQSKKLTELCGQISTLEDLFLSRPPGVEINDEQSVSMTAVYVENWLRFQYLINILESSLVDIKFLWTEGELSLEYSPDEVVELIKAIFAESPHRRSAIAAIKGYRGSG